MGGKHVALHANDIADVQELFEHRVVHRLILAGANIIALKIKLHPVGAVLHFGKRRRAHDAEAHQPPGQPHDAPGVITRKIEVRFVAALCFLPGFIGKGTADLGNGMGHVKQLGGVGVYAHPHEFFALISSVYFLFA